MGSSLLLFWSVLYQCKAIVLSLCMTISQASLISYRFLLEKCWRFGVSVTGGIVGEMQRVILGGFLSVLLVFCKFSILLQKIHNYF